MQYGLQKQGTSSQQGTLSATQNSPLKEGLFGLYSQIKENNVDFNKTLFPKKYIKTSQ